MLGKNKKNPEGAISMIFNLEKTINSLTKTVMELQKRVECGITHTTKPIMVIAGFKGSELDGYYAYGKKVCSICNKVLKDNLTEDEMTAEKLKLAEEEVTRLNKIINKEN